MFVRPSVCRKLRTEPSLPPQCNPAHLDLCEDLSDLQSLNESGVLHTLSSRARAGMPLTQAGPNLVNVWPPVQTHSKVSPLQMILLLLLLL